MRIFQSTYKDKRTGDSKRARKWYIEFRDHRDAVRRLAAFTDKGQTEELARKIETLVMSRCNGRQPDPDLQRWLEAMPPSLLKKLIQLDLLEGTWISASQPLSAHLEDFREALSAKGNTERHVDLVVNRATKVITGCAFKFWHQIQPSRVMSYLQDLRQDSKGEDGDVKTGISAQTFNFYLQAIKQFCRWMVQDRRAAESPITHLSGLNVRTDRRHDRRALTVEELRKLLTTTHSGPTRGRMTGPERAMLYHLAVVTGLRAGELRSLTRASFDLDADPPTVTVAAAYSKRRREDTLPLRADTAELLRELMARLSPAAPLFKMPVRRHMVDVYRADLEVAGIPYRDDAGRVADFHALRHTFITNLTSGGVRPKVAQTLARHSTITLTMDRYSHTYHGDQVAAVESLPRIDTRPAGEAARTGTDDRPEAENSAENSADRAAQSCNRVQSGAAKRRSVPDRQVKRKPRQTNGLAGNSSGEGGILCRPSLWPTSPMTTSYIAIGCALVKRTSERERSPLLGIRCHKTATKMRGRAECFVRASDLERISLCPAALQSAASCSRLAPCRSPGNCCFTAG